MRTRIRTKKKLDKLNLIPILDAVFIFIFFLLMSAQFIDIHEIGSDTPAVATYVPEKDKKPPLNLVLEIKKFYILVKTGFEGKIRLKIKNDKSNDMQKLQNILAQIKSERIEERTIIIRPDKDVPYSIIVKVMDTVKEIKNINKPISGSSSKGKIIKTTKLFEQIIFETII